MQYHYSITARVHNTCLQLEKTFCVWYSCIATVKTLRLIPFRPYNQSDAIQVGKCDHGPLRFTVSMNEGNMVRLSDTGHYGLQSV